MFLLTIYFVTRDIKFDIKLNILIALMKCWLHVSSYFNQTVINEMIPFPNQSES